MESHNYRSQVYPDLNYRFRPLVRKYGEDVLNLIAGFSVVAVMSYWASFHIRPGVDMFAIQLALWGLGSFFVHLCLEALSAKVKQN